MLENIYQSPCLASNSALQLSTPRPEEIFCQSMLFACLALQNKFFEEAYMPKSLLKFSKRRFQRVSSLVANALPNLKERCFSNFSKAEPHISKYAQSFRTKIEQWIKTPLVTGNKEIACKKIIQAHENAEEVLDLSNLQLNQLPDEICDLEHLKVLKLKKNLLRTLPLKIGRLENLERIDCSKNALVDLPLSFLKLQKIQRLNLAQNRLICLPEKIFTAFPKLSFLNCSENALEELPKDFENAKNLLVFDCCKNKLLYLPFSIEKAGSLMVLRCKGNEICLRGNFFQRLPKLLHLDLDYHKDGHMFYSWDILPVIAEEEKLYLRAPESP